MRRKLHLLVIDPQNDFCDLPAHYLPAHPLGGNEAPALPVSGAHADMLRIADLIKRAGRGLSGISVTLDSHQRIDIAHPTFWFDAGGAALAPFTEIAAADVRAGRYLPRRRDALPRVLAYLDTLEASGRYRLMVWPVHCEIGAWGHNIHADVRAACNGWQDAGFGAVNMVNKGENPWTEHYSAVLAEVPDRDDPATQLNRGLIATLARNDRIYICGEAGSHCVKATTEHIVAHIGAANVEKLVLLTDCMSAVAGCDAQYHDFVRAMLRCGVQTASAADVLPELLANAAR
ncbi:cysteine hydrolase [Janthinobacterium fluminis]|uniref:Cysteine hydrolase n=1 Tax=Janthinobacterium fluminis TaxID=2987524 RepID=A0ABT5K054_9BURK|nr:cysteine hydrolase [Janthinobacterium fluminis]MDC8757137.1 cysteine hydrolase [Janthinobacterium fluminis]